MKPSRIKLRAAIARSPSRASADDDYGDEPEPNMKLSHAFVVVLVLHVIAVAGVFAFNTIKARQSGVWAEAAVETPKTADAVPPAEPAPAQRALTAAPEAPAPAAKPAQPAGAAGRTHEIRPGDTLTRIASLHGISVGALQQANAITDPTKIRIGDVLKIPAASAAAIAEKAPPPAAPLKPAVAKAESAAPASKAAGKTYEVVKGDNPVSIAKRLKVSYDELMALNAITDPRKLQIGQKLKVPASH